MTDGHLACLASLTVMLVLFKQWSTFRESF